MRFTKPAIAALTLPAGKTELIAFDDALPGFGIRIRAGGKRTWIVQFRASGRQRRITLGRVDAIDLPQAHSEARKTLARVGLGADPAMEKERAKEQAALTLAAVAERYLAAADRRLRPRSMVELRRHLTIAWSPLAKHPLNSIDRALVASHLATLRDERGPVAADRARAALSALYGWAMREGIASANPVAFTNRPAEPRARTRTLSDAELTEIWNVCHDDDYGRIAKMLLLTAARRDEVASATWSEIDADTALWTVPTGRTKNGRELRLPLSNLALSVLAGTPNREGRDLLFGAGKGGFSGWSRAKQGLDARITAERNRARAAEGTGKSEAIGPMPHWTLHDLRRTAATRMADIGIQPHIIEAVLNHASGHKGGIAGVYNLASYAPEMRLALVRWSDYLEALFTGRKPVLVSLRSA